MVSRKKGSLVLALSSLTILAIALIEGVVLVPVYLNFIGTSLYGAWLATGTLVTYMGLLHFGVNAVIIQKISYAVGRNDKVLIDRYVTNGLAIGLFFAIFPALLAILVSGVLGSIVDLGREDLDTLRTAFLLAGLGASFSLGMYAVGGVLVALQKQTIYAPIQVTCTLLGLLVTIISLFGGMGLLSIPLGVITRTLSCMLIVSLVIFAINIRAKIIDLRQINSTNIFEFTRISGIVFLAETGKTIVSHSDNLIVAMILGSRSVVVYSLTKRAFDLVVMVVGHVITASLPSMAHLFGEENENNFKTKTISSKFLYLVTITSIVLVGGVVIFDELFVNMWVGSSYFGGNILIWIMGIYSMLFLIMITLYNGLFAHGNIAVVSSSSIAEAVLRVTFAYMFCHWMGLIGVSVAAVCSLLMTSMWIFPLAYSKKIGLDIFDLRKSTTKVVIIGAGVGLIGINMNIFINPSTLLQLSASVLGYLSITITLVLLVDNELKQIVKTLIVNRLRLTS